jgi:hypothetical protein
MALYPPHSQQGFLGGDFLRSLLGGCCSLSPKLTVNYVDQRYYQLI